MSWMLDVVSVAGLSIRFSLIVIYESRWLLYSLLLFWWYIDISRHLVWDHIRVHTCNRQIIYEPTKYQDINTE
jgi:hypothetical protein